MAEQQQDVQQRLKEATEHCLSCYAAWTKDKKDAKSREKIMEAVHELRKVAARLEIELAVSERDQMAANPIPIPPHRSAQYRGGRKKDDQQGGGKNAKNQQQGKGDDQQGGETKTVTKRTLPPRKRKTGTENGGSSE